MRLITECSSHLPSASSEIRQRHTSSFQNMHNAESQRTAARKGFGKATAGVHCIRHTSSACGARDWGNAGDLRQMRAKSSLYRMRQVKPPSTGGPVLQTHIF